MTCVAFKVVKDAQGGLNHTVCPSPMYRQKGYPNSHVATVKKLQVILLKLNKALEFTNPSSA